jgi:hypothetical protein
MLVAEDVREHFLLYVMLQNIKKGSKKYKKEEMGNKTSWGTRFVPLVTRTEFSCVFLSWLNIGLAHYSFYDYLVMMNCRKCERREPRVFENRLLRRIF